MTTSTAPAGPVELAVIGCTGELPQTLGRLRQRGILTDEELAAQTAKLLG